MKSERAPEINRRLNVRNPSEKLNFTKHLVGFWRDLQDNRFPAPAKRVQPRDGTRRDQKAASPAKIPPGRAWLAFLFMLLANYLLMRFLFPIPEAPVVPYTLFKEEVGKGNVEVIYSRGEAIEGRFKTAVILPPSGTASPNSTALPRESQSVTTFKTTLPLFLGSGLEALLIDHGVEISANPIQSSGSPWATLLIGFGPAILIIAFYVWLFRRAAQQGGGMGGALMGIGTSKARRYDKEQDTKVTFDDVAGIDEAENELVEIVDFLKAPEKYTRLGGTAPKGVLLVGAPGTGKTLLARAVAGEAGVPFFSTSGAEFVEMIVGVGAARVRDLFKQARENAPAIIFIDEIDAIGRARSGAGAIASNDEREHTLEQLLVELDGFEPHQAIIVLAATNRPDVLDPALLRPGRFDRQVTVDRPERRGREAILRIHTRNVPLAADVNLEELARGTPGFSGADLANLVNEAALAAARRGKTQVERLDFQEALDKLLLGGKREALMDEHERRIVAYHEGGHALVAAVLPGVAPLYKVTIVPRGRSLGVTQFLPEDDRRNYPRSYLLQRLAVALGGRSGEEVALGEITSGAENDLKEATKLARRMVTEWGMGEKTGLVAYELDGESPFLGQQPVGEPGRMYSEVTAERVDAEVERLLEEAHQQARTALSEHRAALERLAQALLQEEVLDRDQVLTIIADAQTGQRSAGG